MSQRFEQCFVKLKASGKSAFVSYIMASDPDYTTSEEILMALPDQGVDIIELGLPFSDPTADGPVIQAAANRALQAGGSVKNTLKLVEKFRTKHNDTPIVLMGYYNPILHYGIEAFANDAANAGVDGLIIVDLPPEEENEAVPALNKAGLSLIRLASPTTDVERAKIITQNASGFVYYISVAGITGQKSATVDTMRDGVNVLRQATDLPIAVGFGIKTPEQAQEIAHANVADAIVVGSALVQCIAENTSDTATAKQHVLTTAKALATAAHSRP